MVKKSLYALFIIKELRTLRIEQLKQFLNLHTLMLEKWALKNRMAINQENPSTLLLKGFF